MFSLQTTQDAPACNGVIAADAKSDPANRRVLQAIKSFAPMPKRKFIKDDNAVHYPSEPDNANDTYYPRVFNERKPTKCPWAKDGPGKDIVGDYDCSTVPPCGKQSALGACTVTVIDRFTSSFHWAEGNVSAVWLRPQWYLLKNSVITDVQNGGLTFVSGGDYTQVIQGYWALVKNTLFVGNTVDNERNAYSRNVGPFNVEAATKLLCDRAPGDMPNFCLSAADTISMPVNSFMTNQRLSNIYDGPSYQDSNAYLDIHPAECTPWVNGVQNNCMYGSQAAHLRLRSTRPEDKTKTWCYLPHAAIGWKQPNGFYYPPAFHSKNLFFGNVDLRHYVIDPLFSVPDGVTGKQDFGQGGTYLTNKTAVTDQYCLTDPPNPDIFSNWTAIDRQTELNDDDGTLTGLTTTSDDPALRQTISVNEDTFFTAPLETAECASSVGDNAKPLQACSPPAPKQSPVTAKTSPYDYVSTVVYHIQGESPDQWDVACNNETCYGVPLYRQYLTGDDGTTKAADGTTKPPTREWKQWFTNQCNIAENKPKPQCRWPFIRMAGTGISQRNTMTVNNGRYYLDTTVSRETQTKEKFTNNPGRLYNVFRKNQTYQVFFVYAKDSTAQTYQIYVGDGFDKNTFRPIRVDITSFPLNFNDATGNRSWATIQDYDKGILTVRINFSGVAELKPTPTNGLCQPRSFCKPKDAQNKDVCVSALPDGDPLKPESELICGSWAVKDLDCPASIRDPQTGKFVSGGCFGFSFTLPDRFEANDSYHRPDPKSFPSDDKDQGKPNWLTQFKQATKLPDAAAGSQCYYDPKLPPVSAPCPPTP
jgi:cell migration-inducing and hyaluronan-binding protein